MTIDPTIVPGLLLLLAEFVALAAVGYVIVRVALRRDRRPGCAGAGPSRRTGDLGRHRQPRNVRSPGTRRSYRGLDIRAGAGRSPDLACPRAGSAAAAHGGGVLRRRFGALLGRARQQADMDTWYTDSPGAVRIDPGRADFHPSCPGIRASPPPTTTASIC